MVVNAAFRCKTRPRFGTLIRGEIVWSAGFASCENFDDRVLHRTFHNDSANCTTSMQVSGLAAFYFVSTRRPSRTVGATSTEQ